MKVLKVKVLGIHEIKTKDGKTYYIHYFENGVANVFGKQYASVFSTEKYEDTINVAYTGKGYQIIEI